MVRLRKNLQLGFILSLVVILPWLKGVAEFVNMEMEIMWLPTVLLMILLTIALGGMYYFSRQRLIEQYHAPQPEVYFDWDEHFGKPKQIEGGQLSGDVYNFDVGQAIERIEAEKNHVTYNDLATKKEFFKANQAIVGKIRNIQCKWERHGLDRNKTLTELGKPIKQKQRA